MQNPYSLSPMAGGLLICLGGAAMAVCGYFHFDDVVEKPDETVRLLSLAAGGYLVWILGSVLLAKARFSSLLAGFLCGVILVPGLFILLTMVRTRTRQEVWQAANPALTGRAVQRQYRDVKSLY